MRRDILTLFESNPDKLNDPFIQELLKIIEHQAVIIEKLEAEIKRLKKHPPKPPIKPSTLEKDVASNSSSDVDNNPGASKKKRSKKAKL